MLEIKNLHVTVDGKQILNGLDLTVDEGRGARHHGPERLGQVDARLCAGRQARLRGRPKARSCSTARTCSRWQPDERAAKGLFLAFQYPLEIPGVATMTFLRTALNAQRKKRGEAELSTPEFIKLRARSRGQARDRHGHAAPRRQCRLLRRREEAQRDPADGAAGSRGSACSTRPIPASTSTR